MHTPALTIAWLLWQRHRLGLSVVLAWLLVVPAVYCAMPAGALSRFDIATGTFPFALAFFYALAVFSYGFETDVAAARSGFGKPDDLVVVHLGKDGIVERRWIDVRRRVEDEAQKDGVIEQRHAERRRQPLPLLEEERDVPRSMSLDVQGEMPGSGISRIASRFRSYGHTQGRGLRVTILAHVIDARNCKTGARARALPFGSRGAR